MVCDFLKYGTYCTAFQRMQICGALRYIVYSKYAATLRWLAYASCAHHRKFRVIHISIFLWSLVEPHETTDTLAGMTDGAQYSQALHERSVLTANMCLEAQQCTTLPLVFALTTALDLLGIERPDEKTITLTNAEKLYVHVTASDLGDEEKERMLALRVASKIGQHLSQRVGIYERHYPSMALGFGTLIAGRVMGHFPPECRGPSPRFKIRSGNLRLRNTPPGRAPAPPA